MEDGFVRVDNAGTGFLLIQRDVLNTMKDYYRWGPTAAMVWW